MVADIHGVVFRNCTALDTTFGCHIKMKDDQAGHVSNITYEGIKIYQTSASSARRVAHGDWPGYAIGIHQQNQGNDDADGEFSRVQIEDVTYRDVQAEGLYAGQFVCAGGTLTCRGLLLERVHLNSSREGCTFTNAVGVGFHVNPASCLPPSPSL
eukprot:COSAG02_NODE_7520_length_2975_cov_8.611613_2_plen_155_part_00